MSLAEITAELEALTLFDFDPMNVDANGDDRLHAICAELAERDDPQRWAPLLYSLMELLAESLPRKPSPLTVWMANRVLDSDPPDTPEWLELLRRSADHPAASAQAQADARGFLEYQATRPQRP